uniref:Uncharacterized protein n=1 Tax=Utricularia reniformis TaxID=192314 RepID=A0A1Y0B2N1_9LAMI|nr:hypothetical protein AEK19_MT1456 [Utricularia reniformis]ART31647.1 hypothetical protein AEK19_MT1456 [Utricularia reniformis]
MMDIGLLAKSNHSLIPYSIASSWSYRTTPVLGSALGSMYFSGDMLSFLSQLPHSRLT